MKNTLLKDNLMRLFQKKTEPEWRPILEELNNKLQLTVNLNQLMQNDILALKKELELTKTKFENLKYVVERNYIRKTGRPFNRPKSE